MVGKEQAALLSKMSPCKLWSIVKGETICLSNAVIFKNDFKTRSDAPKSREKYTN